MDVRKNERYTVTIEGITSEGSGVARIDGFAVFVPGTAAGDVARIKVVKVLRHYAYGILEELETPSPDRIENDCPVFRQCGGCCYRHISYEAELRLKQQQVEDAFARLGNSLKPLQAEILVDRAYILSAMGLLSQYEPDTALKIMKKELLSYGTAK